MLANTQPIGIDMLGTLAECAANCAASQFKGPVALIRCDDIQVDPLLAGKIPHLESWLVRADDDRAMIAAFATIRGLQGGDRIAAAGRFTFSLLTIEKDLGA